MIVKPIWNDKYREVLYDNKGIVIMIHLFFVLSGKLNNYRDH